MEERDEIQKVRETPQEEKLPDMSTPRGPRRRKKKKKKGKLIVIIVLLLLLLIGGIAGGIWWYQSTRVDETTKYWFDKMAQDGSLEGKTPEEVQGVLDAIVEEGMFNVSINARAVFPDGTSEGSIGMENIAANRYYCRMILRRNDDGTVLYESAGLKPGQFIDKVKLTQDLPAGTYACTAQIIATDPESLEDIGQVRVEMELIVVD